MRPSAVVLTDAKSAIPQATQKMEVALQQQQQETRDKARRRLKHKLAGDLDMIILKALRKEPQRRYISVEQFSEDVRRYLEGRPVIARSDTFGYRTTKFLRRNAGSVAAAAIILLLLVGATVLSFVNAAIAGSFSRTLNAASSRSRRRWFDRPDCWGISIFRRIQPPRRPNTGRRSRPLGIFWKLIPGTPAAHRTSGRTWRWLACG